MQEPNAPVTSSEFARQNQNRASDALPTTAAAGIGPDIYRDYWRYSNLGLTTNLRENRDTGARPKKYTVDAQRFVDLFCPWLGRFTKLTEGHSGQTWITIAYRLGLNRIQEVIDGKTTLGWYSSVRPPVLGIDLDDHITGGWQPDLTKPLPGLLHDYHTLLTRLPVPPSLVLSSPRGLHIYYLFSDRLHWQHLHLLARELLTDLKVELKPTPKTTLRIPCTERLLDPDTLQHIGCHDGAGIEWDELPIYDIDEVFGKDWHDRLLQETRTTDTHTTTIRPDHPHAKNDIPSLVEVEENIMPFRNGETYKQLFTLTVACAREGMSFQKIRDLVDDWLAKSPGYTGDIGASPSALDQQIKHILDRGSLVTADRRSEALPLEITESVTALANSHPFVKQRTKSIHRFCLELAKWKLRQDAMNIESQIRCDDLYPYYLRNRRLGYYPLPSSLLRKWNKGYTSILAWLLDIEVLEKSPFPYGPGMGICNYYRISLPTETQFGYSFTEQRTESLEPEPTDPEPASSGTQRKSEEESPDKPPSGIAQLFGTYNYMRRSAHNDTQTERTSEDLANDALLSTRRRRPPRTPKNTTTAFLDKKEAIKQQLEWLLTPSSENIPSPWDGSPEK